MSNAEEEVVDQEELVDEVVEETPVEEVTEEVTETEEVPEETQDDEEARRQRRESQIDRLKKERDDAKAELAKYKTPEAKPTANTVDDATLARLEIRGVTDHEEQQYVLRFAKSEGISPVEALSDEVVKDKLAFMKKNKAEKRSSQTPGNRVGVTAKSVDYYISKNEMPKDPVMAEKVQNELARRSQAGA